MPDGFLDGAVYISADGTTIAGNGDNPFGFEEGWIAVIADIALTDFIWSGTCGGSNWHAGCNDSNWDDLNGLPAGFPPGDSADADETATIVGALAPFRTVPWS